MSATLATEWTDGTDLVTDETDQQEKAGSREMLSPITLSDT